MRRVTMGCRRFGFRVFGFRVSGGVLVELGGDLRLGFRFQERKGRRYVPNARRRLLLLGLGFRIERLGFRKQTCN
jgi:hypothetical protein